MATSRRKDQRVSEEFVEPGRRRHTVLWLVVTVAAVLVASAVPLAFNRTYYYVDDSQVSYFGRFYHFGQMLADGQWPVLNPWAWRSGDYVVETSWGLFSPIVMFVALVSTVVPSALQFMTALKLAFLAIFGAGTFMLARSYRVSAPLACLSGVAVPLAGYTTFMEAPSWSVGLLAASLMPWAWWGLRRIGAGGNPFVALVFGFLLISLGYVSATIALALLGLGCLFEALLRRHWSSAVKVVAAGALYALVVVLINLPGYLSAGVTRRGNMEIRNIGRQVADVGGFLSSSLPTAIARVEGFWGPVLEQPQMYISWLLPLLFLVDWSRLRSSSRDLASLWFVLAASLLWTVGPSNLGPIRVQMRMMPFVVLALMVVVVVLLDRARLAKLGSGRLWPMLGSVALAVYLTFSQRPNALRPALVAGVLVAAGLLLVWWLTRRAGVPKGLPALACLAAVVWTLGLTVVQHHYYPRSPGPDLHMPGRVADMKTQLPEAEGDTIIVGDGTRLLRRDPEAREWLLLANTWYVNPARVQNLYSAISYRAYGARYCMGYHGDTCPEALGTLFDKERRTGEVRADLLSVSTVVVIKDALEKARLDAPPDGWHQAAESPVTVTWVRDRPLPSAGGVAWTDPATDVEVVDHSSRSLTLRVDDVPEGGGTVVLSRLAWPGYSVTNAEIGKPVDGYLLTLEVPENSAGGTVEVSFTPPGWRLGIASGVTAVGGAVGWSLVAALLARRRRRLYDVPHSAARGEPTKLTPVDRDESVTASER